jgi:hypothetical protein
MTAALLVVATCFALFCVAQAISYRRSANGVMNASIKLLGAQNQTLLAVNERIITLQGNVAKTSEEVAALRLALLKAIEENPEVSDWVQGQAAVSRIRSARMYMMEMENRSRRAADEGAGNGR